MVTPALRTCLFGLLPSFILLSGIAQTPITFAQTPPSTFSPLESEDSLLESTDNGQDDEPSIQDLESSYILGPGDEMVISVFGYEEYNTGAVVVEPDGKVVLPVIGTVLVAGKTSEQVSQEITSRLNYYLIDPSVTISLTSLRPVFVTVNGEVQRPGPIQLISPASVVNNINGRQTGLPNLSTALVTAGGITRYADIQQIRVRRMLPDGEAEIIEVNLWDNLGLDSPTANPLLQDGDDIFVPTLSSDNNLDPRLIARSTLAPETVRVRVVGEVTQPGEVLVPPSSTLSSAVAIAGGPTEDARLSRTSFIRLNEDGVIENQRIDLSDLSDDYQVQDGDVLIVPKRNSASILDFAARMFLPLNLIIDSLDDVSRIIDRR